LSSNDYRSKEMRATRRERELKRREDASCEKLAACYTMRGECDVHAFAGKKELNVLTALVLL